MPSHCVVVNCHNHLRKNPDVTYHALPKDPHLKNVWKEKICRTELPKDVFVCSEHFEEHMFDQSYAMRQRLLPKESRSRTKHKLIKGAYPTLFPHRSYTTRDNSKKRIEKSERKELVSSLLKEQEAVEIPTTSLSIENSNLDANINANTLNSRFDEPNEFYDNGSPAIPVPQPMTEISVKEYYESKNLVCVATQTSVYNKDAMTSMAHGGPVKRRKFSCQVNISVKKPSRHISYQFPTPKKRTRKFKRKILKPKSITSEVSASITDERHAFPDCSISPIRGATPFPITKLKCSASAVTQLEIMNSPSNLANSSIYPNSTIDTLNCLHPVDSSNDPENTSTDPVYSTIDTVNSSHPVDSSNDPVNTSTDPVDSQIDFVNIRSKRTFNASSFGYVNSSGNEKLAASNFLEVESPSKANSSLFLTENPSPNEVPAIESKDLDALTNVMDNASNELSTENVGAESMSESGSEIPPGKEPLDSTFKLSDSDYCDNSSISDSDISVKETQSEKEKIRNERTLLVYESKLFELLRYCPQCGGHVDQSEIKEVKNTGSQLYLQFTCFNNCTVEWKSQPSVGKLNGLGNLFLATSISFSGIPFAKFERFAWLVNLKFISSSTYYQIRRDFIFPVVKRKWKKERERMTRLLKERDLVVLVGDGRMDSPGFSAKYCTYTLMETRNGEVVDTVVVPVTEVKNSNAMEKEGFMRAVNKLKESGVKIDMISTDRHVQIRNLLKVDPEFNDICHQFDPWHIIKGIVKKMSIASKKKSRQDLIEWMPSIVNHFWWCIETSEGNEKMLYEKFSSLLYHTANKHEWPGCTYFKACAHERLSVEKQRETKWLVEGSESHKYLCSIIKDKNLRNDLKQVNHAICTTNVEVFNNLLLKYIPKQYHFEYDHMVMGSYLAALEHNFNSLREQDVIKSGPEKGKLKYAIAWRKPTKKLIARKVYQKKRYDIFKILMSGCYSQAQKGKKRVSRKRVMAPKARDSKEEIVKMAKKHSRFERSDEL